MLRHSSLAYMDLVCHPPGRGRKSMAVLPVDSRTAADVEEEEEEDDSGGASFVTSTSSTANSDITHHACFFLPDVACSIRIPIARARCCRILLKTFVRIENCKLHVLLSGSLSHPAVSM